MSQDTDVDLEAILGEESSDSSSDSASTENDEHGASDSHDQSVSKDVKPSERENARVRNLTEQVNSLKTFIEEKLGKSDNKETPSASELDKFLNSSVGDAGSRKVLREYADVLAKELTGRMSPEFSKVKAIEANETFNEIASKVPGLSAHKAEVMKTLQNNPNANIKAVIGEIILNRAISKVKPVEDSSSSVNRSATDLDSMDTNELYDLLESQRP